MLKTDKMLRFIPLLLLIAILTGSCAAIKKDTKVEDCGFPQSWSGNWEGELKIFTQKGEVQHLPMEVEIYRVDSSDNRFHFALIYGEDKKSGRRPYQLIVKDPSKGLYVNDEMNGILMEEYFIGNKLYCWFEVNGTQLLSTFEKKTDVMYFEIIAGSSTPSGTSGGVKYEGEDIPVVKSFSVKNVQRAVLKKKK